MWFTPIILRWRDGLKEKDDGVLSLAADLALPAKNVRRWKDIDSVPADWFAEVARAAARRGFDDITVERLALIAEERRLSKSAQVHEAGAAA